MTWTELHDACVHQVAERITRAAKQHAEEAVQVDEHGWTPLHILCWGSPSSYAVKALIDACPQATSAQDTMGNTPLHVACSRAETDNHLVQLLLQACPTATSMVNQEGLMPLHMACRYASNNSSMIGLLIKSFPNALRTHIKVKYIKISSANHWRLCFWLTQ
jgi:ankyrin repeat protein